MVIDSFLRELDACWPEHLPNLTLKVIGSGALMLQANYRRTTKDSDILETTALTAPIRKSLLQIAGENSSLHRKHRIYLDIVGEAIPFLPQQPNWRSLEQLSSALAHFSVEVLDVVDVVVSKLKRFNTNDQTDIDQMIEADLVDHQTLLDRFHAAVDAFMMDARAEDLPLYVSNLNRVERDMLDVDESEIELPSWI